MVISINIVIAGAGIGGLAAAIALRRAGHSVVVLEGAKELSEAGAGIQVPPNTCRILEAWNLLDKLKTKAVWPSNVLVRRYSTGEIIGCTPLKPNMIDTYGYPYLLIHRYDYQTFLYEAAIEAGAQVILDARVESVDDATVSVKLVNGTSYSADLIIGADGIRSKVRAAVVPEETITPKVSDSCIFRVTVPTDVIRADPKISHLVDEHNSNCWIGYRRHIVAYPISNGRLYNIVSSCPGEASAGLWNEPCDLEEMRNHYCHFDPVIQRALSKATSCSKWTLADLPILSHWVSPSGKVALLGDAAHAMLPYLAQGAAQAIEDSACLGVLLSRLESTDEIPDLLRLYEKLRRPRAETIQKKSVENGVVWHLPDGDLQVARDIAMMASSTENGRNPNQLSDPKFQPWLYGYDAIDVASKALKGNTGREFEYNLAKL